VRVDVHTHLVPERWEDWAARYGGGNWPRLEHGDDCRATIFTGAQFFRAIDDRSWNPARRLEDMDRLRIDVQALSPPPVMFCYWADAKATQGFARPQNANVAEIVARHPKRFVGMATVPPQDPALAIEKLRHARETLGLSAVEIGMDRVVIGSDYPFDMGSDDPVGAVESAGLGPAARAAIVDGANAARFLGLSPG